MEADAKQSVPLLNLSWELACQVDSIFFFFLFTSMKDDESAINKGLGVSNKFADLQIQDP